MKFSVIITVFNANADYLRECIDSVLHQDYNDVEVIVIDDGSTNCETLAILNEYRGRGNFGGKTLEIHRKPNGGQGSARNAGFALATGDYILFLDSDDYYMTSSFFYEISELLTESRADILSFQYEEFFDEGERPQFKYGNLPRERVFNKPVDVAVKSLLTASRSVFSAATHTKVIKSSFLRDNNIIAVEGLSNEDISLTAMIIHHAKTYDRYDKVIYAYRRTNTDSISTKPENSFKIANDILSQFQILLSNTRYNSDRNVLDFLASPFVYWLGKMVSAAEQIDNSAKDNYTENVSVGLTYSYVLRHSSRPYIRLFGVLLRLFGISFAMSLLRTFLLLNRKNVLSIHRKKGL